MIVLDASVLIAHFDSTDAHHDRAGELLLLAADQDQTLGASPITLQSRAAERNLARPETG